MNKQANRFIKSPVVRLISNASAAVLGSAVLLGSPVLADTVPGPVTSQSVAAELIYLAGIPAQLSLIPESIVAEATPNFVRCGLTDDFKPGDAEIDAFAAMIDRHFGSALSRERAVNALAQTMTLDELKAAKSFYATQAGGNIIRAEFASKELSEANFVRLADAYFESIQWTDQRERLIKRVYDATRAARYVSILNGEVSVAVQVSSHCTATLASYKQLSDKLKNVRTDARFVEPLMAADINSIMATVFRDVSNEDLRAYVEFAESDVGKSFFNSLLDATRRGISGGLKSLRDERIATFED